VWVERLRLTDFRNYRSLSLSVGPAPVVLAGANGSGKTNLLEAVSLLTSGQGLRRAPYPELARMGATAWAVAARLNTPLGGVDIGTGLAEGPDADGRPERIAGRSTGRHRARRRRGPVGFRCARRPRRDGVAHPRHGWSLHGPASTGGA
jgi:DNA replication and repair protein RecF